MRLDLIVVSLERWDDVWRRNQHLVAGIMRDTGPSRVLFVEPPADVTFAIAQRSMPRRGRGLRTGQVADAPGGELWLYQPTKLLPRKLDPGFDRRRARAIQRIARRLHMPRPVVWINDADGASMLDARWPTIYDVTDDWLAADRPAAELDRLTRQEAELLDRVDEVVVCSPALARSKGRDRPTTVITNGVDIDAYVPTVDRPADLPAGRVAVYIGTLHADRLDVELCAATAAALRRSDGSPARLVLVGPDALGDSDRARIEQAGGVILGSRPARQVPAYALHADTLVVPHLMNAFTDSLNPIKLYEYLAAGRPVVSTPVAGFREYGWPTITLAEGNNFAAAVASSVRHRSERVEPPADLPIWTRQAREMAAVLDRARETAR